jgi:hypothetical protein
MKAKMLVFVVGMSLICGLWAGEDMKAEQEAVKKVIQMAYVDGLCNTGDIARIKEGFHPGFNLLGVRGTLLNILPIYNWIEYVKMDKKKGKYPAKEKVTVKFQFVDVTGNAAVAKLHYLKGGKHIYTDYLSLYKFPQGWRLVNKIYYKHDK